MLTELSVIVFPLKKTKPLREIQVFLHNAFLEPDSSCQAHLKDHWLC